MARKTSIGVIVKTARMKNGMTREQLAKKLDLSVHYVGHIERDAPVRISERVMGALKYTFKSQVSQITLAMIEKHNKRSTRYYSEYRKSRD